MPGAVGMRLSPPSWKRLFSPCIRSSQCCIKEQSRNNIRDHDGDSSPLCLNQEQGTPMKSFNPPGPKSTLLRNSEIRSARRPISHPFPRHTVAHGSPQVRYLQVASSGILEKSIPSGPERLRVVRIHIHPLRTREHTLADASLIRYRETVRAIPARAWSFPPAFSATSAPLRWVKDSRPDTRHFPYHPRQPTPSQAHFGIRPTSSHQGTESRLSPSPRRGFDVRPSACSAFSAVHSPLSPVRRGGELPIHALESK
jgi:hypothetical protein